MPSNSSKSAFKMASEDPQKMQLKSTKNMNFLASLAISEALTINPTDFLRPPFDS